MSIEINAQKFKVLIESSDISKKVEEIGKQINRDYKGKDLLIVGVLKGGLVFLADLIRLLDINFEIDFIRISSYKEGMEPSEVELLEDIRTELEGRDVLLVEDLIDTGATLEFIMEKLAPKHPKSLKICALIKKNKLRKSKVHIDYLGFEIEDNFIVGFGTDYAEQGRNLADIYVIEA